MEEKSLDLMCAFDNLASSDDSLKYDQYDDDYVSQIKIDLVEESEANLGNKEIQAQQLGSSDQLFHCSDVNEEESAENFEISEETLPCCFDSF